MAFKDELEMRLEEGYAELAEIALGSDEYEKAAKALKNLQEAYNDIVKSENAKEAIDIRRDQNTDMLRADLAMRALELGTKTIFKSVWNSRYMIFEKDGVIKTLGARNSLNDTNRW